MKKLKDLEISDVFELSGIGNLTYDRQANPCFVSINNYAATFNRCFSEIIEKLGFTHVDIVKNRATNCRGFLLSKERQGSFRLSKCEVHNFRIATASVVKALRNNLNLDKIYSYRIYVGTQIEVKDGVVFMIKSIERNPCQNLKA